MDSLLPETFKAHNFLISSTHLPKKQTTETPPQKKTQKNHQQKYT